LVVGYAYGFFGITGIYASLILPKIISIMPRIVNSR
jgi:hypothetical protein